MSHPVVGLREMARDAPAWCRCGVRLGSRRRPEAAEHVWEAARELDPDVEDVSQLAGTREGQLAELFQAVGLHETEEAALSIDVEHPSFEDWWEPFTLGVGPAGSYAAGLEAKQQARLRELCREMLPAAPFVQSAWAWAARALV